MANIAHRSLKSVRDLVNDNTYGAFSTAEGANAFLSACEQYCDALHGLLQYIPAAAIIVSPVKNKKTKEENWKLFLAFHPLLSDTDPHQYMRWLKTSCLNLDACAVALCSTATISERKKDESKTSTDAAETGSGHEFEAAIITVEHCSMKTIAASLAPIVDSNSSPFLGPFIRYGKVIGASNSSIPDWVELHALLPGAQGN